MATDVSSRLRLPASMFKATGGGCEELLADDAFVAWLTPPDVLTASRYDVSSPLRLPAYMFNLVRQI